MFRAKAEKVSGSRVFANGKWLICIGNKPVNVGDLIYTDGRCVYGFYQESQQPMVITSPKKEEDWGIPILWISGYSKRHFYIYKDENLQEISLSDEKYKAIKASKMYLMINSYKDKVYTATKEASIMAYYTDSIVAANVDKQGNLYRILHLKNTKEVQILKNEEVVKSILLSGDYHAVQWAFIENENNWAFIHAVTNEGNAQYGEVPDPKYPWGPVSIKSTVPYNGSAYFHSSKNSSLSISNWAGNIIQYGWFYEEDIGPEFYEDRPEYREVVKSVESFESSGIKFPMQDGFYFTMFDAYPLASHTGTSPAFSIRNIYSPNDELLFSGMFTISTRLVIYKDLVIVQDNSYLTNFIVEGGHLSPNYDKDYKLPEFIGTGLYKLVDGELKAILEGVNISSHILNQRLRPMTGYKNWTENLIDCTYTEEEAE